MIILSKIWHASNIYEPGDDSCSSGSKSFVREKTAFIRRIKGDTLNHSDTASTTTTTTTRWKRLPGDPTPSPATCRGPPHPRTHTWRTVMQNLAERTNRRARGTNSKTGTASIHASQLCFILCVLSPLFYLYFISPPLPLFLYFLLSVSFISYFSFMSSSTFLCQLVILFSFIPSFLLLLPSSPILLAFVLFLTFPTLCFT